MPTVGFEPAIPASEQPQAHALDRVATGIGVKSVTRINSVQNTQNCHAYRPHTTARRGAGTYTSLARGSAWTHTHTNPTRILKFSHATY